jgi:glycerate kinase
VQILLAPDKFKGTLTAGEVARAMERGVEAAGLDAGCTLLPIADGGEGTLDVLGQEGPAALLPDGSFIVEMAATFAGASPTKEGSLRRSSFEAGRLIAQGLASRDASSVVVAVGGTLSTDGGTGAAAACGWSFLDRRGRVLDGGGGRLSELAEIVPPRRPTAKLPVIGACDVDVPLTGPRGSARMFAAQKGATDEEIAILEEGLLNLEERMRLDLGYLTSERSHQGAGGGMGAGLGAFFGARLENGFDFVAERIGLAEALSSADLVVTGEGRVDAQSLAGKAPVRLASLARELGVPCLAIGGTVELSPEELGSAGFAAAAGLGIGDPANLVSEAMARLLEGWFAP